MPPACIMGRGPYGTARQVVCKLRLTRQGQHRTGEGEGRSLLSTRVVVCTLLAGSAAERDVPPVMTVHPRTELAYKQQDHVVLECQATARPPPQ